jgi:hypothetical protein
MAKSELGHVTIQVSADAEFLKDSIFALLVEYTNWLDREEADFSWAHVDDPDWETVEPETFVTEFLAEREVLRGS